jgi:hypothetical protein
MKCFDLTILALIVITGLLTAPAHAQTQYPVVVYWVDMTPRPVRVHRAFDNGRRGWNQSGFTTKAFQDISNGVSGSGGSIAANQYVRWVALDPVKVMDLKYVMVAKSLPSELYTSFSQKANAFDTSRAAVLRRLIFELPTSMVGTRYQPPSPESIMAALDRVEKMTDEQVTSYWSNK